MILLPRMCRRIVLLVAVVLHSLSSNGVLFLQSVAAFVILPKQQQLHQIYLPTTTKFSTIQFLPQYERKSVSNIVLTSSLDVPDDDYDSNKSSHASSIDAANTPDTETKFSDIASLSVEALDGQTMILGDILQSSSNDQKAVVMSCLSHFGDYNAWEMTQQFMSAIQSGRLSEDCPVVLVGIGSVEAATTFADDIGLSAPELKDKIKLVTDETGHVTEALDCYRGWLTVDKKHKKRYPFTDVHPAVKLLGMIFGFGSPGTMEKVVQGYTGDVMKNYGPFGRQWVIQSLQQGGEKGRFPQVDVSLHPQSELKPFELATLRLQTGLHIVAKWGILGPQDGDLFTRMGGTFVLDNNQNCVYEHFDQGILNFANMDDICLVAEAAINGRRYVVPSSKSQAKKNRQLLWARKDDEMKRKLEEAAQRAEEARLEAERLARETKLTEEARLEELDRIEFERIAEIARQGQEAKKAREAEIEAVVQAKTAIEEGRIAENETKAREQSERTLKVKASFKAESQPKKEKWLTEHEEATAAQAAAKEEVASSLSVDDDFDASVEEILMRAEEQEKRIRASLEAIQNVQKASSSPPPPDSNEHFQRNLLAAKIKYEKTNDGIPGLIINGSTAASGPILEVTNKTAKNVNKTTSRLQETFQRKLLAAQLQYVDEPTDRQVKSEIVRNENLHDHEASKQLEAFQRELLAARIKFEKATSGTNQTQMTITIVDSQSSMTTIIPQNGSTNYTNNGVRNGKDRSELFQRNLLATRLRYETSNVKKGSTHATAKST